MKSEVSFFLDINPEPWAVGKAFAMRGRGGAGISPNKKLVAYQNAVREAILNDIGHDPMPGELISGPIAVEFWFSRAVEKLTYGNRKATANYADATNLQKALEDALQGVIFKNDNQVVSISSHVVAQGADAKPGIFIQINAYPESYQADEANFFESIRKIETIVIETDSNTW